MKTYVSFLVVQPGFEMAAQKELRFWWKAIFDDQDELELGIERGGIAFETTLDKISTLHFYLKIPTRILLRIDGFRCRDFSTLFKKLRNIQWNSLVGAADLEWKVSSVGSRLALQKRIEETAESAVEKYRAQQEPPKEGRGEKFEAFLRIFDDVCTLSLNISGASLYKRSQKTMTARAPIRETLAAALLWEVLDEKRNINVVDPLCGSGTILVEALGLHQRIESREFDWQKMRLFKSVPLLKKFKIDEPWVKEVSGFDRHDEIARVASQNLDAICSANQVYEIECRDVFEIEEKGRKRVDVVVSNLPYGERIRPPQGIKKFYQDIFTSVNRNFDANRVAFLAARNQSPNLMSDCYNLAKEIEFENGGIPVSFLIFKKIQ